MRKRQLVLAAAGLVMLGGYLVRAEQAGQESSKQAPADLPEWAWGRSSSTPAVTRAPQRPVDGNELVRIPGSDLALERSLFRRAQGDEGVKEVPDWAPEEHAPMPDIVKFGRSVRDSNGEFIRFRDSDGEVVFASGGVEDGGIRACGHCHNATGTGHPGNAATAGLPVGYIVQQMEDFKNGLRMSSDPRKGNVIRMGGYARLMTPEELTASAQYFASLPFPQMIKVVETDTVPKTRSLAGEGFLVPLEGPDAGTEPIGERIIEVPEHPELTEVRAPNAGFIAYVPVGSVEKGEQLASTLQCRVCHGPDLGGLNMGDLGGEVPPIAGRSPSYMVRQLFDMKTGQRRGAKSPLMKPVVDQMTTEDMVNVAAYVASRVPPARPTQ